MARIRAIEGGFSLLRSANDATSMGFDNYGRIQAALADFGDNDRILIASLPVGRVNTLYRKVGTIIAFLAIPTLLLSLVVAGRNYLGARNSTPEEAKMS